jgi:hypothetical protein
MSKLESKHVLPYVLYGAKMLTEKNLLDKEDRIWTLQPSNFPNNWENEFNSKIILRPLKDLSEIIKGKGVSYTSYLWYEVISTDNDSFNKDEFYENCELGLIEYLPIMVYEQLFKWNFDVFGLIKKGFAVDINTLSVE